MKMFYIQRPLPAIEILMPASLRASVNSMLVNGLHCLLLMVSGGPNILSASSSAWTQDAGSREFDSRHDMAFGYSSP